MIKNRIELAQYFAKLGFTRGAEIGVFAGYYSKVLLDNIPGLELLCVDSWHRRRARYGARPTARKILSAYPGAKILQGHSAEVVKTIPDSSLDFVFIDADHSYECVRDDVREWSKKVRSGGIVSGHDYYKFERGNVGVIQAVDEYVKANGVELLTTPWDGESAVLDDRQPSWYFLKK